MPASDNKKKEVSGPEVWLIEVRKSSENLRVYFIVLHIEGKQKRLPCSLPPQDHLYPFIC